MSPELGLIIMFNNYFHDVATALLIGSGVALWSMLRHLDSQGGPSPDAYFLRISASMTRLARFSLVWIILGGIPRAIYYTEFEWANAVGKMQVPALIVKHIIAFAFVGVGIRLWLKLRARTKEMMARAA